MKVLLDENLPPQHAGVLRDLGHDAIAAIDAGLAGRPDNEIRNFAIESGRVLITLDADFGNILRFPPARTPGVIRLKIHPPTEAAIRTQILRTLQILEGKSLDGCLAVCYGEIIRIRR